MGVICWERRNTQLFVRVRGTRLDPGNGDVQTALLTKYTLSRYLHERGRIASKPSIYQLPQKSLTSDGEGKQTLADIGGRRIPEPAGACVREFSTRESGAE
jgi:hypothetical protein